MVCWYILICTATGFFGGGGSPSPPPYDTQPTLLISQPTSGVHWSAAVLSHVGMQNPSHSATNIWCTLIWSSIATRVARSTVCWYILICTATVSGGVVRHLRHHMIHSQHCSFHNQHLVYTDLEQYCHM